MNSRFILVLKRTDSFFEKRFAEQKQKVCAMVGTSCTFDEKVKKSAEPVGRYRHASKNTAHVYSGSSGACFVDDLTSDQLKIKFNQ